jgi:hypothetical protein
MGRAYSTHAGEEECIQGSGEKARMKEPLRTARRMWKDNNKKDIVKRILRNKMG